MSSHHSKEAWERESELQHSPSESPPQTGHGIGDTPLHPPNQEPVTQKQKQLFEGNEKT